MYSTFKKHMFFASQCWLVKYKSTTKPLPPKVPTRFYFEVSCTHFLSRAAWHWRWPERGACNGSGLTLEVCSQTVLGGNWQYIIELIDCAIMKPEHVKCKFHSWFQIFFQRRAQDEWLTEQTCIWQQTKNWISVERCFSVGLSWQVALESEFDNLSEQFPLGDQ